MLGKRDGRYVIKIKFCHIDRSKKKTYAVTFESCHKHKSAFFLLKTTSII